MVTGLLLAALLSTLIGVVLGMLGGGGAVLTLPMLVYAVGQEPKSAIATSLVVVGVTSTFNVVLRARSGTVSWRDGLVFAATAMIGAFVGGSAAHAIDERALLVLFAVVMIGASAMMLRRAPSSDCPTTTRPPRLGLLLALGAAVGAVSGLVGAGGGFLIVPALALVGGLPMPRAIGTSLFVIALQSFAGFAGHASHVTLDWRLVLVVTAACVVGSVLGASVGKRLAPALLRKAFGGLVGVMGMFMLAKQLPVGLAMVAVVASVAVIALVGHWSPRALRAGSR